MLNGGVCVRLNLQLFMTLKFYGVPKAPKMCIENISLTIFDIVWSSQSYLIPLTLVVRKYPSLTCWPWKLWWKPCNEKIFSLIVQTIKKLLLVKQFWWDGLVVSKLPHLLCPVCWRFLITWHHLNTFISKLSHINLKIQEDINFNF